VKRAVSLPNRTVYKQLGVNDFRIVGCECGKKVKLPKKCVKFYLSLKIPTVGERKKRKLIQEESSIKIKKVN
jgi:hypothetical protein